MHEMHERAGAGMTYLTTRDLQELIRVDKSTIYRMAEDGRLPAVKIGRQWRFPEAAVREMLGQMPRPESALQPRQTLIESLESPATQALADLAAEVFGVQVLVTGMDGHPISDVVNACGLFASLVDEPGVSPICVDMWAGYGSVPDLVPEFRVGRFGFLCARSFIRVGNELLGMVIAGGVAPDDWPPDPAGISEIADGLGVTPDKVAAHIDEVHHLDERAKNRILELLPRFAAVLSHVATSRDQLVTRLEAIAALAGGTETTRSEQ